MLQNDYPFPPIQMPTGNVLLAVNSSQDQELQQNKHTDQTFVFAVHKFPNSWQDHVPSKLYCLVELV